MGSLESYREGAVVRLELQLRLAGSLIGWFVAPCVRPAGPGRLRGSGGRISTPVRSDRGGSGP